MYYAIIFLQYIMPLSIYSIAISQSFHYNILRHYFLTVYYALFHYNTLRPYFLTVYYAIIYLQYITPSFINNELLQYF